MEWRIHHVAISAIDLDETVSFYGLFGFEVLRRFDDPDGVMSIVHLELESTILEVFWFKRQMDAPASAAELKTDLPTIGVKHFGLQVESIEAAKSFVEERGIATDVEIQTGKTGVRYFFVKDPSGILLEFVEDNHPTSN